MLPHRFKRIAVPVSGDRNARRHDPCPCRRTWSHVHVFQNSKSTTVRRIASHDDHDPGMPRNSQTQGEVHACHAPPTDPWTQRVKLQWQLHRVEKETDREARKGAHHEVLQRSSRSQLSKRRMLLVGSVLWATFSIWYIVDV